MRLRTLGGLWIENSRSVLVGGPRPRPLALLAILAAAGTKGTSRDRAIGILWPDSDSERARHALSQTIYSLRRDLGVEVVLSTPDLRLDGQLISSDIDDFGAAIGARNWEDAAHLYTGPFLEGFYLADAPEFERWVDEERASLASAGVRAIEFVAKERTRTSRHDEACELWRKLTRLDPFNARFATSFMESLAAAGDRAAALAHGRVYSDLVRKELDAEPDGAVPRLMARLRDASSAVAENEITRIDGDARPAVPADSIARHEVEQSSTFRPLVPKTLFHRRHARPAAAIALTVLAVAFGWRAVRAARAPSAPVLAVGRIQDLVAPDSVVLGGVLSEMLATSLARLNDLQVVANSRMLELTSRDSLSSRGAMTDAARRAGATEIIEGELIPLPDRQLRLEVRRVDITRGLVRGAYRISGSDRIALFDSVTSLIAADLRVGVPTGSLGEVSTRSPIAYRFYEEGLRAFHQFDAVTAARLFRAAVREDSTFAMATYYAWRSAVASADPAQTELANRAVALASHASPRDRLLILTHLGHLQRDAGALAAAESLAIKYPRDPEALTRAGDVIIDLRRATALLNHAISLDSAAGVGTSAVCRMCETLDLLTRRYVWADSADAAERTLDRWRALRPHDSAPWQVFADLALGLGRHREAEAAQQRFKSLGGKIVDQNKLMLVWDLRSDDFADANGRCERGLAERDPSEFVSYRWFCSILFRAQGRYREALALVREGRVSKTSVVRRDGPPDRYHEAILDMEMGRALVAADQFLALAPAAFDTASGQAGLRASNVAWHLTLAATAAVAGGDTIRARGLVDSIESAGRRSSYSRDPKLHHFVRGLLHAQAGLHPSAEREFRAALVSPTYGYTRINYELGRTLLAMNRPRDAIPVLRAVLRGGLDGPGVYLTRTETHELLAQSFDAAGQRDSATAHYVVVERAWRSADPFLKPRYEAARQRVVHAGMTIH